MPGQPTEATEARVLVCEGPCNPELSQYDAARDRFYAEGCLDRQLRRDLFFWSKDLVHTEHVPTEQHARWDDRIGWVRRYRCTACGHQRLA